MKQSDFGKGKPGSLIQITTSSGDRGLSFLPDRLPISLELSPELERAVENAAWALGNLNGLGAQLPNNALLARPFVRTEAIASSRIEGTRASVEQLVLFEALEGQSGSEASHVREVSNHMRALNAAWETRSLIPILSRRGIAAIHKMLLEGVRGENLTPGEYRKQPVWIGSAADSISTARFVPCPPAEIDDRIDNLLSYFELDKNPHLPWLVKLAVSHYQFEVIHPFNDGNGRIGRMLIPILLHSWGKLGVPLLYLSEYFERKRDTYINLLFQVSSKGDWDAWVAFFVEAVQVQAEDAYRRAQSLMNWREDMRRNYQVGPTLRLLPLIDEIFERGYVTYARAAEVTGLSQPAANQLVRRLVEDGVLIEITGRVRNQVFMAPDVVYAKLGDDGREG